MRLLTLLLVALFALSTTACGGAARAQKRAYKAQETVAKERLRLIDEYQRCVDKAGTDALKREGCESHLKAAQALD
ncbi:MULTISPECIES: hypothetical protein [Marichromatium]|uniref:Uncharacterized protein n=1 Tax=Marichromatium gracile TaxID=1048 RepID=A0A4R4AB89_MARGR|nr:MULTISPECIES: hypothetical protein [Marichromatium]MBO8085787.1 hypothetical protein [Marichromatium sp.]MBK1709370.1 hypothetical protein [Marichromatium gracile]RNE88740.1 hypothetical protein EBL84_14720 [Marichromatium sp. AB31]RNE93179.1 hypothetical protein EBL85_08080 [Marichromatium sp. AB32]TCW36272.1 hypothetical protein EDC29_10455 [Marichromatium gracile]